MSLKTLQPSPDKSCSQCLESNVELICGDVYFYCQPCLDAIHEKILAYQKRILEEHDGRDC